MTCVARLALVGCLSALMLSRSSAQQPDPFASQIKDTPPLAAEDERRTFHVPPGFEIQLVAAEPMVRKPINLNFDDAGRLYVTESVEYPYPNADPKKSQDRVTRLTMGPDGRATEAKVVARELSIPIGLAPWGDDLFVFSIPEVLRLRDTNDDGKLDERSVLLRGFGQRDTHGLVNAISPWIDGWIYTCHGFSNESTVVGTDGSTISMQSGNTFRWQPDGSRVEHFTHGQVNPFGMAFDALGNIYTADCHTLPAYQLLRGACYPSFAKPSDGLPFGPAMMSHKHGSTGIAGVAYYAAPQFPAEYQNTIFIGNPITNRVNHDRVVWHGATPEAVEQPDFVVSDDPWFRPVDIKLGPDGALYIADFYNRIIGHYEVPLDHPGRDRERGRIWRVVYRGVDGKLPLSAAPDVANASPEKLIELLGHYNLTTRVLATNRLAREKLPAERAEQLFRIVLSDQPWTARVHALWVIERRAPERIKTETWQKLLNDPAPGVRIHALKALTERGERDWIALWPELLDQLVEGDPLTRRAAAELFAARAIRAQSVASADRLLLFVLLTAQASLDPQDTHLQHALLMALRNELQIPGAYVAFESLARNNAGMNADSVRQRVADASLGIADSSAGGWLLGHIERATAAPPPQFLEHATRHVEAARLPEVVSLMERWGDAPARQRAELLAAVSRGFAARGYVLHESLRKQQIAVVLNLLSSSSTDEIRLGLERCRDWRAREAYDAVRAMAARTEAPVELRESALETCVALGAGRSVDLLIAAQRDEQAPQTLRKKARQLLGAINENAGRASLLDELKDAPAMTAGEIALALLGTEAGCAALLEAVEQGKASRELLLDAFVNRRLRQSKVANATDRLNKLLAGMPPPDARLRQQIEKHRQQFASLPRNATRGQEVFRKTCAACHRVGSEGNKIGPELDGIGLRGLDRILEDVLDPNRNVDQTFRATQVVLTDGRVLTGLVVGQEGEVTVLADGEGKLARIPADEIEQLEKSALSPMPTNVAAQLPPEDLGQLLHFLLDQRQKSVAAPAKKESE